MFTGRRDERLHRNRCAVCRERVARGDGCRVGVHLIYCRRHAWTVMIRRRESGVGPATLDG